MEREAIDCIERRGFSESSTHRMDTLDYIFIGNFMWNLTGLPTLRS